VNSSAGGSFSLVFLSTLAVTRDADMICTANRVHLPEGPLAGGIEIIGPGRLAAELGVM
jgi:hypothetical protein